MIYLSHVDKNLRRLDKPSVKKRIDMIAKRMFKDVRKKEVERKKG